MSTPLLPPIAHVHDFKTLGRASGGLGRLWANYCAECGAIVHTFNQEAPSRCFHCQRNYVRGLGSIYCPLCEPLKGLWEPALKRFGGNHTLYDLSRWAWTELQARIGRRFFMLPDHQPEPVQMEFRLQ